MVCVGNYILFFVYCLDQYDSNPGILYLNKIASVQTDFSDGDSYQKVVHFNHNGSLLITGGSDGVIRGWKVSVPSIWLVCIGPLLTTNNSLKFSKAQPILIQ